MVARCNFRLFNWAMDFDIQKEPMTVRHNGFSFLDYLCHCIVLIVYKLLRLGLANSLVQIMLHYTAHVQQGRGSVLKSNCWRNQSKVFLYGLGKSISGGKRYSMKNLNFIVRLVLRKVVQILSVGR